MVAGRESEVPVTMYFFLRTDTHGQTWMAIDGNDDDAHWWPVWRWEERPELEYDEDDVMDYTVIGPAVEGVQ